MTFEKMLMASSTHVSFRLQNESMKMSMKNKAQGSQESEQTRLVILRRCENSRGRAQSVKKSAINLAITMKDSSLEAYVLNSQIQVVQGGSCPAEKSHISGGVKSLIESC